MGFLVYLYKSQYPQIVNLLLCRISVVYQDSHLILLQELFRSYLCQVDEGVCHTNNIVLCHLMITKYCLLVQVMFL